MRSTVRLPASSSWVSSSWARVSTATVRSPTPALSGTRNASSATSSVTSTIATGIRTVARPHQVAASMPAPVATSAAARPSRHDTSSAPSESSSHTSPPPMRMAAAATAPDERRRRLRDLGPGLGDERRVVGRPGVTGGEVGSSPVSVGSSTASSTGPGSPVAPGDQPGPGGVGSTGSPVPATGPGASTGIVVSRSPSALEFGARGVRSRVSSQIPRATSTTAAGNGRSHQSWSRTATATTTPATSTAGWTSPRPPTGSATTRGSSGCRSGRANWATR